MSQIQKGNNPEHKRSENNSSSSNDKASSSSSQEISENHHQTRLISFSKNLFKQTTQFWSRAIVFITGVCGYFLNREALNRQVKKYLSGPKYQNIDFDPRNWEMDTVFMALIGALIAYFVISNLHADWACNGAKAKKQKIREAFLQSKNSIQPISVEEYKKNMNEMTHHELSKLRASEEFQNHMENRNVDAPAKVREEVSDQINGKISESNSDVQSDLDSKFSAIHKEINKNANWNKDFTNKEAEYQVPDNLVYSDGEQADIFGKLQGKIKKSWARQVKRAKINNQVNESVDEVQID